MTFAFRSAYVTATGAFLPGAAIDNEHMDAFIAPFDERCERIKHSVLSDNGIRTRHYAIDEHGKTRFSATHMASEAVRENIVDLESATELYTPMFQLLLSDRAFWRSSTALQLDETISLYVSKLLNMPSIPALANNKHPMVPLTTLRAGFRLVLHGLSTELLHALLVEAKLAQLMPVDQADQSGTFGRLA